MSSPLDIARAAWGDPLPDWIEVLARQCASTSQRQVADALGRSAGLVSQVLHNKYKGDVDGVEAAVRGVWLNATVECPALGTLPINECQAWRRKAKAGVRTNALRVRMSNACQICPRNQKDVSQ